MEIKDFIIIGGGPSGILCGIECTKANLSSLIIEKGSLTDTIYHFPDKMTFFSTSEKLEIGDVPFISNAARPSRDEALEYYRRLCKNFNLKVNTFEEVLDVVKINGLFEVKTSKSVYFSRAVVIATGYYGIPVKMDIPGEELAKVSHYYKNSHPYIGKDVIIVGAANSACDAALECWQKGANVTMIIRGNEISPRVKYWIKPNIENRIKDGEINAYFNSSLVAISEDVVIVKLEDGSTISLKNDFVLAMTGYRPDYEFIRKLGVEIRNDEYLTPMCNDNSLETNIDRLYLAGVVNCGMETHKLYIENTRDHGSLIVKHYLEKAI